MVFSIYIFLFLFLVLFLVLLLALYFVLPARLRGGRNGVLLCFSLVFYAWGGPAFLPVMLLSIAANYLFGLLSAGGRRGWLAAGPIVRYVTAAEELRCRRETLADFSAQGAAGSTMWGFPSGTTPPTSQA